MKTILVLSEDSAKDAFAVVRAVSRQILAFLSPALTGRAIRFVPLAEDHAKQAVHGNLWKSRNPRDQHKRIALMRTLLTHVLMDEGFVVFHIDGDQTWARRDEGLNLRQFQKFVSDLIQSHADARTPSLAPERLQEAFKSRLLLLVPFYSIESWLYQSTACAVALCDEEYRGKDRERFAAWARDRGALDEVVKPKEQVVLGGRYNLKLAEAGLPTGALHGAGKSFAQAVESFRACRALLEP